MAKVCFFLIPINLIEPNKKISHDWKECGQKHPGIFCFEKKVEVQDKAKGYKAEHSTDEIKRAADP